MPRSAHSRKIAEAEAERLVPGFRVALLRADMERHAIGFEAEAMGMLEHVHRHLGHAAELARQRPFGAGAVAQDAAEHLHVGRRVRSARAIFSTSASQSTAKRRTPSSRARAMSRSFLIVLPKEMRSGVAPASSASSISTTEAVSKHEPSSARSLQHLRRRIGLHGVEHARVGERPGKAWRSCRARRRGRRPCRGRPRVGCAGIHGCAAVMALSPPKVQWSVLSASGLKFRRSEPPSGVSEGRCIPRSCDGDTRTRRWALHPTMLPWIGWGVPRPHAWQ